MLDTVANTCNFFTEAGTTTKTAKFGNDNHANGRSGSSSLPGFWEGLDVSDIIESKQVFPTR